MGLKAVGLTHVRYERGDHVGHVMAWASLLPVFLILGSFPTLIAFKRNIQTAFFWLGFAVCECINQALKRSLRVPRPPTCALLEACSSFGWPSSHSQCMAFFATYTSLLVLKRCSFSDAMSRNFCLAAPWAAAWITMESRIYLGYHSLEQVIAGATIGVVFGGLWFLLVNRVLRQRLLQLEATPLCRYLCFRDESHIPNDILFEFTSSQAAREKKMTSKKK